MDSRLNALGASIATTLGAASGGGAAIAYADVVSNDGATLTVKVAGSTVSGIRRTASCVGATAGDRAILLGDGPLWTAIEIVRGCPYPVGSIYMSYESTSPAQLFGGTWAQLTGVFPRFANDTATGGADSTIYNFDHNHYMSLERPSGATWSFVSNRSGIGYHDGDAAILSKALLTSTSALTTLQNVYGPVSAYGGTNGKPLGNKNINAMPAYQDVYAWRRTA